MKTTKITTTLASLTMIFFMSTSSFANTYSHYSGDGEKTSENTRISAAKNNIDAAISTTTHDEFIQLRFDVKNFVNADKSEISEMPSADEFKYLRFDVNNFSGSNSGEVSDMPENEFDYLRFDVNKFESENIISTNELPAK